MNLHAHTRRDPRRMAEIHLHDYVIGLLRMNAAPDVMFWHCPNGEARSEGTGAKLLRMGVLAGVADINLLLPGPMPAFLELKGDKGSLSVDQRRFLEAAARLGCKTAVVRTPEEALAKLLEWGAIIRSEGEVLMSRGKARAIVQREAA